MATSKLSKAALLTLFIVLIGIGSWEIYLRSKGIHITYDNGKELWADKRAKVYEPAGKTTVFTGSSRIKFDLDIDTWEKVTGRHAIQLAIEGSSPVPMITDLGDDPKFQGKLVIDVTEILFFSTSRSSVEKPNEYIHWYTKQTPAERASFILDHALESNLVFLDRDYLSLNEGIESIKIPNRPGVFVFPEFPMEFDRTGFNRQTRMSDKFLADTSLQHQVQNIWAYLSKMGRNAPPPKTNPIPAVIATVKTAVDKIRSRGGEVVFIRTPSSGPMAMGEQQALPREKAWEPLLAATKCTGIYYADNPATSHFVCPEWSHLSPSDAILYTKTLIGEMPPSFTK